MKMRVMKMMAMTMSALKALTRDIPDSLTKVFSAMEMIASISYLEERFYLFYMVPINVRLMQCKCFKSSLISACSLLACF
jgi:hypothetical protein